MSAAHEPLALAAEYFDGQSARALPVRLSVNGKLLVIEAASLRREVPLQQVSWPERQRHGVRLAHLDGGGSLRCADAPAWDNFVRAAGVGESLVVKAQQSWRATLATVAALLVLCVAGYLWGLPWAARATLVFVPTTVDAALGESAFEQIGRLALQPSALAPERQQRLSARFTQVVNQAYAPEQRPSYTLHFRSSKRLGANAFALPGGTIVMTDQLVELMASQDDVIVGVLAHELGHVRHRHGMRALTQATLLAAAASVAFGDFSSLLAGVPALLGHLGYSRGFEREADLEAIHILRAGGISPEVMMQLFEAMARERGQRGTDDDGAVAIAFSSHPADAERIAMFRAAAQR